jgi:thiamine pyrophosphokinase
MSAVTTIQIQKKTREELRKFGTKGETYDQVLAKLMKAAKKMAFFEEIDQILETEEFVSIDKI